MHRLIVLVLAGLARAETVVEIENQVNNLFRRRDYDKAIPLLDDAHKQHPDNLKILSLLGMAHLYGSDARKGAEIARSNFEKVIEAGGEAVIIAAKAKDKLKGSHVVAATPGELRMSRTGVTFAPLVGGGASDDRIPNTAAIECGPNSKYGKDSNTFHVRAKDVEWNLRPLHFSREEGQIACELLAKYLNAKTAR